MSGARQETAELRKNLLTAEAIIKAEPQVLVFWEQGQGVFMENGVWLAISDYGHNPRPWGMQSSLSRSEHCVPRGG